jgi:adenylate kinase
LLRIVLLGLPGAGKGTQAKRLAEHVNVAHIASGDLFRTHLANGTELGSLAKDYMDRGKLVPDEVTISMVLERIEEMDAKNGYVLDGFPRTMEQARALDRALEGRDESIDCTPLIDVDTEELVKRLAGRLLCKDCQTPYHIVDAPPKNRGACDVCGGELYQRDDDKPEVVAVRLEAYNEQTAPLINYYEAQGKVATVNGQQGIELVMADLLDVIQHRVNSVI